MADDDLTDLRQETIETYNRSAAVMANHFNRWGNRQADVNRVLELLGPIENPKVLEIGCGDGQDAKLFIEHTNDYLGFDLSDGLIKVAKQNVPEAWFEVADACQYEYPKGLQVVYASASLLHMNQEEVGQILAKVSHALVRGGIFFMSLKYKPIYGQTIHEDNFGKRLFYFYAPENIERLAGDAYKTVFVQRYKLGSTEWFKIALQRQ
jgi:SAM-dependent methyltransferase